jgi:hypothetical protein
MTNRCFVQMDAMTDAIWMLNDSTAQQPATQMELRIQREVHTDPKTYDAQGHS